MRPTREVIQLVTVLCALVLDLAGISACVALALSGKLDPMAGAALVAAILAGRRPQQPQNGQSPGSALPGASGALAVLALPLALPALGWLRH